MRICLDVRVQTQGGTSTFMDNFVRNLIDLKHRHEVLFLTNKKCNHKWSSQFETIKVPVDNPILQLAWIQGLLPSVLNRKKVHAYYSLKHLGPIYCPVRSIYHLHAVGQFCGIYPLSFLERFYWIRLRKMLIDKADLIIAVSNYIRTFLIEHLDVSEERVITIYNGLDEYFQPLSEEEIPKEFLSRKGIKQPFILCAGKVSPVKNHETAIKAYKLLKEDQKIDETLIIAGGTNHPHFPELQKLVAELRLKESVRFVGYQSKYDLLVLYNFAEMLVHPSLHEGFGFTVLEAMSCGLPTLCSKITSLPEIAGDAAIYYNSPKDSDELAYKMKNLIDSKDLRDSLSAKGIKRAKQFSWSKCVQQSLAVYDKL